LAAANTLAVEAVKVAYNQAEEWVDQLNDHIERNMRMLKEFVDNEMSDQISFIKPESTYLAWIDLSNNGYSEEKVEKELQSVSKIETSIENSYKLDESHHFRLNVACSEDKLIGRLEAIKQSFNALDNDEIE